MTAPQYTETEVKLYVKDLTAIEAQLQAIGATLKAPRVLERNLRLDNADRTLRSRQQVLRLRQDEGARITFKEDPEGGTSAAIGRTRFEAETSIGDLETMRVILERIGFTTTMSYEKYRTTYELEGAEILLDEMPYGSFVEIEGDEAGIRAAMERLGLNDAPRIPMSYTVLFEVVKQALGLSFKDLTFANFSGVAVPETVFTEMKQN